MKTDSETIDDAEWGKAVIELTEEFSTLAKWLISTGKLQSLYTISIGTMISL
jgi:hypothetical protein